MDEMKTRRREGRLSYLWPIWFSEDFSQRMSPGLMVDISSGGVAFTFNAEGNHLHEGQSLSVCFSIPRLDDDSPTSTMTITHTGRVCRIEEVFDGFGSFGRAALQFDEPLALDSAGQVAFELMCDGCSDKSEHVAL